MSGDLLQYWKSPEIGLRFELCFHRQKLHKIFKNLIILIIGNAVIEKVAVFYIVSFYQHMVIEFLFQIMHPSLMTNFPEEHEKIIKMDHPKLGRRRNGQLLLVIYSKN